MPRAKPCSCCAGQTRTYKTLAVARREQYRRMGDYGTATIFKCKHGYVVIAPGDDVEGINGSLFTHVDTGMTSPVGCWP